jgi:hypothetical protein
MTAGSSHMNSERSAIWSRLRVNERGPVAQALGLELPDVDADIDVVQAAATTTTPRPETASMPRPRALLILFFILECSIGKSGSSPTRSPTKTH